MATIRESIDQNKRGGIGSFLLKTTGSALGSAFRFTGKALGVGASKTLRGTGKGLSFIKNKISNFKYGALVNVITTAVLTAKELFKGLILRLHDYIIGKAEEANQSETANKIRRLKDFLYGEKGKAEEANQSETANKIRRLKDFLYGEKGLKDYDAKQIAIESAKNKEKEDFKRSLDKEEEQSSERRKEIDEEKKSSLERIKDKLTKKKEEKGGILGAILGTLGTAAGFLGKIFGVVSTIASALLSVMGLGKIVGLGKGLRTGVKTAATIAKAVTGVGARALLWGARLAFLNPVGLTATAVAGSGYLLYKGYKWLNRNDTNSVQKLRMMYYGLSDLDDKNSKFRAHVSTLYNLEEIALETIKIEDSGEILTRTIEDPSKVYSLFKIDMQKEDMVRAFDHWYTKRFMPVLIEFVRAGFFISRKLDPESCLNINEKYFKELTDSLKVDQNIHEVDYIILNGTKMPISITQSIINDYVTKTRKDKEEAAKQTIDDKVKDKKAASALLDTKSSNLVKAHMNPLGMLNNKNNKNTSTDPEREKEPKNVSINPVADQTMQNISDGLAVRDGALQVAENKDVREYIQPGSTTFKKIEALNPTFLKYLLSMAKEYYQITGKKLVINSAFRSIEEQKALAATNPNASKGLSMHNFGLAADIPSAMTTELDKLGLLRKYGFTKPVGQEKWHIESIGVSMEFDKIKQNPSIADALIEKSIGRGGSGWADVPTAAKLSRNVNYLKKIYDAPSVTVAENKDNTPVVQKASDLYKTNTTALPESSEQKQVVQNASDIIKSNNTSPITQSAVASTANTAVPITDVESIPRAAVTTASNTAISSKNYPITQPASVTDAIAKASESTGLDKDFLMKAAYRESKFDASAKNSQTSATGLFQFTRDTWHRSISAFGRKYGLDHRNADINNPLHNALMAAELALDNYNRIKDTANKAGIDSKVAMYLAHHFGSGDSRVYLKNYMLDPNRYIANSELAGLIKSNPHLRSETFGSFIQKLNAEFGGGSAPVMAATTTAQSAAYPASTVTTPTPAAKPTNEPQTPISASASTPTKPTTPTPSIAGITPQAPMMREAPAASAAAPAVDMKNLENIASQQLNVLNQIRDLLKESLVNKALYQEPAPSGNPFIKASSEPIRIPDKKVSMGVI